MRYYYLIIRNSSYGVISVRLISFLRLTIWCLLIILRTSIGDWSYQEIIVPFSFISGLRSSYLLNWRYPFVSISEWCFPQYSPNLICEWQREPLWLSHILAQHLQESFMIHGLQCFTGISNTGFASDITWSTISLILPDPTISSQSSVASVITSWIKSFLRITWISIPGEVWHTLNQI